jgi:beta-glucosidase
MAPGQSVVAEVATEPRLWRRWDTATNRWATVNGAGHLLVARGLGDIRAMLKIGSA